MVTLQIDFGGSMVHATDGDGGISDVTIANKSKDFSISLTKLSNESKWRSP